MGAQQTAQDTAAGEAAQVEAPNPTQEATDEPEAAEESRCPTCRRQKPTGWWEAKPAGKATARNGAADSVENAAVSVEEPSRPPIRRPWLASMRPSCFSWTRREDRSSCCCYGEEQDDGRPKQLLLLRRRLGRLERIYQAVGAMELEHKSDITTRVMGMGDRQVKSVDYLSNNRYHHQGDGDG